MYPWARELVRLNLIRLVIIDSGCQFASVWVLNSLHMGFFLDVSRNNRVFFLNCEFVLLPQFGELIVLENLALYQPLVTILVLHPALIPDCDLLGCFPNHHVGVKPHTCQQTHQHDRNVETVAFLLFQHVCWGRDDGGKQIRRVQVLILDVFWQFLGRGLSVVQLKDTQFCWPDCCADKFVNL